MVVNRVIQEANESLCQMTGYSREELLGQSARLLYPTDEDFDFVGREKYRKIGEQGTGSVETRWKRKDGSIIHIILSSTPLHPDDLAKGVTFTALDITARKVAEDKVARLLKEKELLLLEVHHRIKNNMNIVMSLLSLQAERQKEPEAVAALLDARSRVGTMMVLYDKLYRSAAFTEVSIKEYLSTLVEEIAGVFPNRASVRIDTHIDDVLIDVKVLSAVGIIVNELLTNAMKHAFADRTDGAISVSASLERDRVTLVVQDNGVGLPMSYQMNATSGFGAQLVGMLAGQIGGTISFERNHGTKCILEFPVG